MEERHTKYEPFVLSPLRLQGIFGITWRIYKRGFFSMLLLTLLLTGLPAGIMLLPWTGIIDELFKAGASLYEHGNFEIALRMLSGMGFTSLVALLSMFLLTPMYSGTAYAEYGRRMRGEGRSAGELIRGCGKGLKRYYGTYWANVLVMFGLSIALSIVLSVVLSFTALSFAFSMIPGFDAARIGGMVAVVVVVTVVSAILETIAVMFLSFVYPAAVAEGKLNFRAIGQSFRLVGRRFWRVLGVSLISVLALGLLSLLLSGAGIAMSISTVIAGEFEELGSGITMILAGSILATMLYTPYAMALNTVLYYDAVSRDEKNPPPFDPAGPIVEDMPAGGPAGNGYYDAAAPPAQPPAAKRAGLYDVPPAAPPTANVVEPPEPFSWVRQEEVSGEVEDENDRSQGPEGI